MSVVQPEHPEIAAALREAQRRNGLSDAKLARLAGISRRHLGEVMKGSNVSVRILKKVMTALQLDHIHLGELMQGSGSLRGVSPDVLRVIAEGMEEAVAPLLKLVATLKTYGEGKASPELNSKARDVVRKAAGDAKTKVMARRVEAAAAKRRPR